MNLEDFELTDAVRSEALCRPAGPWTRRGRGLALILIAAFLLSPSGFSRSGNRGSDQPVPRIIGGVPAADGAYPWMVAVLQRSVAEGNGPDPIYQAQFCGGTLIASQWVLSAAHCFANDQGEPEVTPAQLLVMIDEITLVPGPTLYNVDQVIVHEGFNTNNNSFTNDIALLRLAQPVNFPTLPFNENPDNPRVAPGMTAKIIGWGSRMWDNTPPGTPFDFPFDLHEADVPIISNQECQTALPEVGLNDTHLCAGILNQGGVDTCAADSGGPIFVSDGQGGFLQAGITSFGIGCGLPNRPGVYTRVSSFVDWILDNISGGVIVPHWGNGQGLVTDLIVYNRSQANASQSEITFRDGDGNDLPTGTLLAEASAQELPQGVVFNGNTLELPPLGIHTISTTGLGALVSGSISLTSTGPIGAAIRFRIPGIGISGVGSAESAVSLVAPARRVGALNTGVAIHNPGSQPVTVDLVLKNPAGQEVPNGRAVLNLPARGQVARFINQLFPDANTTTFQGTICATARSGRIAAVALELGNRAGEFTTLPVSPTTP